MTSPYLSATLVIVDPTVNDYQTLVNSVSSDADIVLLDADQDGIEQITRVLAGRHGVESLHILCHGSPGVLQLGNTQFNLASLNRYVSQIQSWTTAFAAHTDILLYGCRVAADAIGQRFVEQLSQLTGAAIAASTHLTGNAALGGDWALEFTTGQIRTPLVLQSEAMEAYRFVLATVFLNETFTGDDVIDKSWLFGIGQPATSEKRNPFLTARATVAAPTGGLPGNPASAPAPPIDAVGNGVLRLTNSDFTQAAYVLYNRPFSSSGGLSITFDFFSYGGTGADGISFFLLDGSVPATIAGGFGGSLGYAPIDDTAGIPGGYLGIGFDEFGNYSNPTFGRVGGPGSRPDAIAVRGSQATNYRYLTGTDTLPFSIDDTTVTDPASRELARRRAQIDITPTGLLSVRIDSNQDGDFLDPGETPPELQNFDIIAANGSALPDTLTFGFASSTGGSINAHEIRNLLIATSTSPPIVTDALNSIPPSSTVNLTGLSGTDPDGTVTSFTILTVPPPSQGTLFLNNPQTGGTPVSPGQVIPPTQISQLFFQTAPGFTGGTFTYTATDDLGAESLTPGTVSLNLSTTSNIPPSVASPTNQIPPGATVNLTGISGTDPDGTIASFTILTTPSPGQGALFLGNPAAGGTPVSPGQAITPAQVNQLFFRPTPNFTGGTFTYTATDNLGATDPTPGTVNLTLPGVTPPGGDDGGGVTPTPGSNLLPTAENLTVDTTPDLANQLPPLFAIDPDGSIGEIILLTLPTPDQGILYLGSPFAGGTPIALGQELTPAEASQLYFQATSEFTGGSFTYYAIDNLGGDSNTATVRLNSATGVNPLNPEARCRPGRTIRGQNRPNNLRGTSDRDTILGRSKNDSLRGLDCADMLDGAQGDDRAFGGNAADMVRGRSGHDRLNGDDGDDRMEGGTGRDQISGDRGNDTGMGNGGNDDLRGKGGNDNMIGNKGNDRMFGGVGKDALSGRQDRDFIRGGAGDDIIRGGLGFDNLSGDQKADIVDGGGGNDMVRGGGGIDSLYGKRGNDRIFGGTQVDYISGNQGNDRIIGGGGADIITGGLGSDHFVYRNVGQGGDIIREFRVRRDKIDVRSIFSRPEYGRSNEFRRYLRRVQLGSDTVIRIDANGDRAGGFQDFITLLNVNANRLTVRDFIL